MAWLCDVRQLDRHCERLVWLREICDERAAHVATKSQPDRLPEGSVPELEGANLLLLANIGAKITLFD
eukprot:SAG31_NODE_1924_length_6902_cov_5.916066_3_plen_68_part_00